jgi:threonine dehydrogenase-like Zn-dependent dehydrogenase
MDVAQASPSEPFLGLIIEFDLAIMREVMEQLDTPAETRGEMGQGVFVIDCDGPLADCALRAMRLLEARRLMVADAANVETAAFQVGYESPSQFSREYSRMFGAPPRRDITAASRATAASGLLPAS